MYIIWKFQKESKNVQKQSKNVQNQSNGKNFGIYPQNRAEGHVDVVATQKWKKNKTSWGWAGPSSAQVGIGLYSNLIYILFL